MVPWHVLLALLVDVGMSLCARMYALCGPVYMYYRGPQGAIYSLEQDYLPSFVTAWLL